MSEPILFIGGTTGGGVATINNEVVRVFRAAGRRCLLVDTERLKARFPAPLAYVLAYLWSVALIAAHRPRVVYLQIAQTGYLHQSLFLLWAKLLGRRTIAHFHAKADLRATCTPRQLRRIVASQRYIDAMIVLTEPCRRSLAESGWRGEIHVVPNFIAIGGLPASVPPVAARRQILYLGRMEREKGIFEILNVARRLPQEEFVFVGGFADRAAQAEFIGRLDETPNARWLGPIYGDEKYRVIAESRYLLFPTWRDEFPMTLIEATILGCIPLVSRVGSVGEIVRDGFNGVFIQPGNTADMVARIAELQARPDLQKLADNGMEFARAHFTSDAVRDKLIKIVG